MNTADCDVNSSGWDPMACGDSGDPCDPRSYNWYRYWCEMNGGPNVCDPNSFAYDDYECSLQDPCDPESPRYDPLNCPPEEEPGNEEDGVDPPPYIYPGGSTGGGTGGGGTVTPGCGCTTNPDGLNPPTGSNQKTEILKDLLYLTDEQADWLDGQTVARDYFFNAHYLGQGKMFEHDIMNAATRIAIDLNRPDVTTYPYEYRESNVDILKRDLAYPFNENPEFYQVYMGESFDNLYKVDNKYWQNNPILHMYNANGELMQTVVDNYGSEEYVQLTEPPQTPILIAKSPHSVLIDPNGNTLESMLYNDKPDVTGLDIPTEDLYSTNEKALWDRMIDLFKNTSVWEMETVGLEMIGKFKSKTGGIYTNQKFTEYVVKNDDFEAFQSRLLGLLKANLNTAKGDITKVDVLTIDPPVFNDYFDKIGGLGITVHGTWAAQAEILKYSFSPNTRNYKGILTITIFDDFGLDRRDILTNKDRWFPIGAADGFKAWYVLQHYRGYVPFTNMVTINVPFSGRIP